MPVRLKIYFTGLLFLLSAFQGWSQRVVDLDSNTTAYDFFGKSVLFFEDESRMKTFEDIRKPELEKRFQCMKEYPIQFLEGNKVYWIKLEVHHTDDLAAKQWIIEFLDFRIKRVDVYLPSKNGGYLMKTAGFSYPLSQKEYKHKNYVFNLETLPKGNSAIYARITSNVPVTARVKITTVQDFNTYALAEYFLLSLYYGICIAMLLYNLFLYMTIRDITYGYYILYVLGAILFSFSRDGLGFHFIWPEHPQANSYMFNFSNLFMIFWEVMYARSFLNLSKTQPRADLLLKWVLAIRIGLYLLTTFVLTEFSSDISLDIITLFIIFCAGIKSYKDNYKPATYYLVAFIWMLVGYIIFALSNMGLVQHKTATIYSVNFGIVGEMLLLSFALASRIKILQKEKIVAQNETIKQLVVNEELKDSANRELEHKVSERTRELEVKNKELDAFVYKASHDLKGPLNSIVGLATIGQMEDDPAKMKEYFRLTKETAKRLQSTIVDLLSLTKVKETTVNKRPLKITELVDDVIENFAHDENYKQVTIKKEMESENDILSDESLLKSILQNLIENGLKYRDPKKDNQQLDIQIKDKNNTLTIKVRDNGLGIPVDAKEKIFDMFFKINPKSMGSGLGLHILKTAVQKLGGTIELESSIGKGSTFTVKLPNSH